MNFSSDFLTKAKEAKSESELIDIAYGFGIELTEEKAKLVFARLKGNAELTDDELENISGGSWWDDFINWLSGEPSYIDDISYNPVTGRYFCPECDDGNHTLSKYSGITTTAGYDADVYHCNNCGTWFWNYTSGDRAGKWVVRPDQD